MVAACVSSAAFCSVSNAQDAFREFDRKMVATPAELFQALSTFQPAAQRKQIDAQRQKEIEAAGRKFLSNLSPDQQEKAWEFAEKYFRKNGVDSASSQKLMKDFGLPPEMQNELSKQLHKYSNQPSNSDARPDDPDDAISQIMRKAREKFERDSQQEGESGERASPLNSDQPETDADAGSDQGDAQTPQPNAEQKLVAEDAGDSKLKEQNAGQSSQPGEDREAKRDDPTRQSNAKTENDRTASPFELPTSDPAADPANGTNPDSQSGKPQSERTQAKKGDGSNPGELKKSIENNEGTDSETGGQSPLSGDNVDWEKVIENLAEKGSTEDVLNPGQNQTSNPTSGLEGDEKAGSSEQKRLDQGMFDRAKDWISRSLDSESDSGSEPATTGRASSEEAVGTRFDRLLVKAAQRTLDSDDEEQGVSKGVGSMLGSLIEQIQKQTSNKDGDEGQNSAGTEYGGNQDNFNSRENGTSQSNSRRGNDSNDGSNRNSDSARENPFSPPSQSLAESRFDPRNMLDSINGLSAINPTQVFTFFAIVGLSLFLIYLLAKSFIGDEVKTNKRKVIQQIRNTKIDSPKDLVETVDRFLLGKFGVRSSWWNARLAQRVMNSGSPEFQTRVADLIQDYVRARYMRDDIQIPTADQQRYKKTLEELSALDLKPDSNLGLVPASPVPVSPAPVKG